MKPNWQMEFNWGGTSKSWKYFYAKDKPEEKAVEVANEYLNSQQGVGFLRTTPKFPKRVLVRQYDNEKKIASKGGKRFVLIKTGFTAKTNLRTIKEEWYELLPND